MSTPNALTNMAALGVVEQMVDADVTAVLDVLFKEKPQEVLQAITGRANMRRKLLHHVRRLEHTPLTSAAKDDDVDKFLYVELLVRTQDSAQDDMQCVVALIDLPEWLTIVFKAFIIDFEQSEARARARVGESAVDPLAMRNGSGTFRVFFDDNKFANELEEAVNSGALTSALIGRICQLTKIPLPGKQSDDEGEGEDSEDSEDEDAGNLAEEDEWLQETFYQQLADNIENKLSGFEKEIEEAGERTRTKKRTRQQFLDAPRMEVVVDQATL